MSDDIPDWLKEDAPEKPSSHSSKPTPYIPPTLPNLSHTSDPLEQTSSPLPTDLRRYREIIYWGFKIITLLLCILMIITAGIGFTYVNGIDETGQMMVAFYMIVFALVLGIFEIIQIKPSEYLDRIYRRNFGFLYGTKGKSFFIIFIAFLSFGITEPSTLCFMTGLLVAAFGAAELGIFLKYPELFEDGI